MDDSPTLDGTRALVTGASSGIGEATALELARRGAAVTLVARREATLEKLADRIAEDLGTETLVAPTDVTDSEAVASAVEATVEAFGGLDLVVANAGILRMTDRLEDMPIADFDAMRAVNVDGTFYTTHAALPSLRESGGRIVFVGSDSAKHPDPTLATYAATKWWTRGFALSLEAREGRNGIGVTVVNPGDTFTDINFEGRPLSETGDPETMLAPAEVARAIAFAAEQDPGTTVAELDLYDESLTADVYRL